ncbi:MAG: Ig-like domain-containing protein [Gemmatimonadetes bacterium]|nr:Ig-like domain-containing protein [Gemmatimonadota bacterium]
MKTLSSFVLLACVSGPVSAWAQATQVVVTPSELDLPVGESHALVATTAEGTEGEDVTWFVSGDAVTVSDRGVVTAERPGEARVAALYRGRPTWVVVRVPQLPADRLDARLGGRVYTETTTPLHVDAYTALGDRLEDVELTYQVAEDAVATIDATGRVLGVNPGATIVTVSAGHAVTQLRVTVERNVDQGYTLEPLSDTEGLRTGDVVFLRLTADGVRSRGRTLQPLWSLSPAGATVEAAGEEGLFVAEEPGTYYVTAVAGPAISRTIRLDVGPRTHTTRLERVGHGVTATHRAGDTWVFEGVDGRDYAYLGTFYHDWMKVWDVTDPTSPVLTDSIQLDARRINDVKIHPNNRLGIVTREGASSRRNGIVLLDLSNPAHPTILSEYTDTVTGGVHNVWILGEYDLVYACHNGTSEIVIIDIANPTAPSEVGRWAIDNPARSLHDVIVQDGYAYASYWDDGVVILDAGAGTHGGTPRAPTFVSSFSYPEGNTHVAWRHGKYLFVGDEIFPDDWDPDAFGPIEARGYVHVLDVTDIDDPVEVARYEVPEAGAHNLWSDDRDRLYIGYYQAGLRVVDISGELRGDLYRQGREIGALKTSSPDASVPNWSMTWGAQLFKGRIYTSDLFSGLWIARLVEEELVP